VGEQKVCNHSMEWNIQAGYSYYRCSYCRFIDGKKTFQEAVAEERERVMAEIEDIQYNSQAEGCGLEDLSITDRYEAMEYGWKQCKEKILRLIS